MIKKRDIFLFILFNMLTLGIYGIVIYCFIGKEVNKICEADGKIRCFIFCMVARPCYTRYISAYLDKNMHGQIRGQCL